MNHLQMLFAKGNNKKIMYIYFYSSNIIYYHQFYILFKYSG